MTDNIRRLREAWQLEAKLFKIKSDEYITSVGTLCKLSKVINDELKKELIPIDEGWKTITK